MDERFKIVACLLDGESVSAVCREFGISRKTGPDSYIDGMVKIRCLYFSIPGLCNVVLITQNFSADKQGHFLTRGTRR